MAIQHVQWRVGARAALSSWGTTCQVCTTAANPWHNGWANARTCAAIDVAASLHDYVYVAGYNPGTSFVRIWVRRMSACAVAAMASDNPPPAEEALTPTSRLVRYLHMDSTYDPRRIPTGSWMRLLSVPPQTAFLSIIGRVGRSIDGKDECCLVSSGPHLHMDAPIERMARNCGLQLGIAYGPSTPAFSFGV